MYPLNVWGRSEINQSCHGAWQIYIFPERPGEQSVCPASGHTGSFRKPNPQGLQDSWAPLFRVVWASESSWFGNLMFSYPGSDTPSYFSANFSKQYGFGSPRSIYRLFKITKYGLWAFCSGGKLGLNASTCFSSKFQMRLFTWYFHQTLVLPQSANTKNSQQ